MAEATQSFQCLVLCEEKNNTHQGLLTIHV